MKTPFFSILIPTRGRSNLLRDALTSALFQDFDDFEVVVSDNYNDDRTQKVLDEFRDHDRLRCIKPQRLLSMPEHWEFASLHAEGTYVLFLTDRSVLKQGALTTIHKAIELSGKDVPVCSWRWSLYDDMARQEFDEGPTGIGSDVVMLDSHLVAANFEKVYSKYPYSLPRGLNSCYRNIFVKSLRERYGTVFRPISPDFSSAFLLLANIEEVLFIDQALFISQGLGASNGGGAHIKIATDYIHSLGESDWFPLVPIKVPLVENGIFQDFLSIRDLAGGALCKVSIDWVAYFERCYRELIEKQGVGLLSSHEMEELFAEWSRALAGFDNSLQREVQRRLSRLGWVKLKAQLKGSAIGPLARRLKRKIDNVQRGGWQARRGQSVLDAAGFHEDSF